MRTPEQTLDLIREALKDFSDNKIPSFAVITIIKQLETPNEPSPEAIKWAKSILKEN